MELGQYKSKKIIAWMTYNRNYEDFNEGSINKLCYVYPRILMDGSKYKQIDANDFPPQGSIEVRITSGENAESVFTRFGDLVCIIINNEYPFINEKRNCYTLKYHSQLPKVKTEIWIEKFSSGDFYQILDIDCEILELQKNRRIQEPNRLMNANLVLLRYNNVLYGPFEYDIKEGYMKLSGLKEYEYTIGEYAVAEIEDDFLIINNNDNKEECKFISKSVLRSPEECENHYDWISNEVLMDSFIDELKMENNYTREQTRNIKEMAHQLSNDSISKKYSESRLKKIKEILTDIDNKEKAINNIVQYSLGHEETKEDIINEVIKNHFEEIVPKIREIEEIQESIKKLKVQEFNLIQEINQLNQDNETLKEKNHAEEQEKINKLQSDIKALEEENKELKDIKMIEENIQELKEKKEKYKEDAEKEQKRYKDLIVSNNDLEKQCEEILENFNDKAKQTARILDNKLLNKILFDIKEEVDENDVQCFETALLSDHLTDKQIIERVEDYIKNKAHRDVTFNDVANYLICLSQGFITTFAGEPGTGKTSLCTILAKSLGLTINDSQKRFIEVSVERGWTSHKDFIGYYNPLTKQIEKSNIDVYNAFKQLDKECGSSERPYDPSQIAPFIILLDEANLSPIEHYWAAFLRNCDFDSTINKTISLGGKKVFHLPNHLRFFATVNFDHTTEELSPRFLDRSWIITLEPMHIYDEIEENLDEYDTTVSFDSLKKAFTISEKLNIDEGILNKWSTLQNIFKMCHLPIMPRNLKMINNYCLIACKCMERDSPLTKFAPLDYAFSQKILPTINGVGENYKELIEELLKECTSQNMPLSAHHLERIKRVAENNMGYYQFFAK